MVSVGFVWECYILIIKYLFCLIQCPRVGLIGGIQAVNVFIVRNSTVRQSAPASTLHQPMGNFNKSQGEPWGQKAKFTSSLELGVAVRSRRQEVLPISGSSQRVLQLRSP